MFKRKEPGSAEDMDESGLHRIKRERLDSADGEVDLQGSSATSSLLPFKKRVRIIQEFNVRDAQRFQEVAAAVGGRIPEGIQLQEERYLKICPNSEEQERVIRETLLAMNIQFERDTSPNMSEFLINGLPPTTLPEDIAKELNALRIPHQKVAQIVNRKALLPLFTVTASRSQTQALVRVNQLCGRAVKISSCGQGKAIQRKAVKTFFGMLPCGCVWNRPNGSRKRKKTSQQALTGARYAGSVSSAISGSLNTLPALRDLRGHFTNLVEVLTQVKTLFQGNGSLAELIGKMKGAPSKEDKLSALLGSMNL